MGVNTTGLDMILIFPDITLVSGPSSWRARQSGAPQSQMSQKNVVYKININNSGPSPDISGHHPGLRAMFLASYTVWSPPEPSQSKNSLINVVYMININTSGPVLTFPDITLASGPSSWRARLSGAPRALQEQKVTNKCCVYDQ